MCQPGVTQHNLFVWNRSDHGGSLTKTISALLQCCDPTTSSESEIPVLVHTGAYLSNNRVVFLAWILVGLQESTCLPYGAKANGLILLTSWDCRLSLVFVSLCEGRLGLAATANNHAHSSYRCNWRSTRAFCQVTPGAFHSKLDSQIGSSGVSHLRFANCLWSFFNCTSSSRLNVKSLVGSALSFASYNSTFNSALCVLALDLFILALLQGPIVVNTRLSFSGQAWNDASLLLFCS